MSVDAISTKITNAALAASSGGAIAAPYFGSSREEMLFYVFGVIVSIIAFSHNECHVSRSATFWAKVTKASRYVIVGAFTYPSAYAYAGEAMWKYSAFQGLAGVVATLLIVTLMDAWVQGKSDRFRSGK